MTPKPRKDVYKIYQITVKDALKENWQDWFNGMLIATDSISNGGANTTFTCRVRDQAELIGIINWLHNRNMVIERVYLFPSGSELEDVRKDSYLAR